MENRTVNTADLLHRRLGTLIRPTAARTALVVMALVVALAGLASPATAARAAYDPMHIQSVHRSNYCTDYYPYYQVPILDQCDYSYEWLFVPANTSQNTYYLVPKAGADNQCLEQPSLNSDHLVLSLCRGATSQIWRIVYKGPGNAYISYAGSGYCLDAPFDGTIVIAARACHYRDNQQWKNS
jgi:hypothetical protein